MSTIPLIVAFCKLRVRHVWHPGNALFYCLNTCLPHPLSNCCSMLYMFFTRHLPPRFVDVTCCFSPLPFIVHNDCYYNAIYVNVTCCSIFPTPRKCHIWQIFDALIPTSSSFLLTHSPAESFEHQDCNINIYLGGTFIYLTNCIEMKIDPNRVALNNHIKTIRLNIMPTESFIPSHTHIHHLLVPM